MINMYAVTITLNIEGCVKRKTYNLMSEETEIKSEEICFDWKNIEKVYKNFPFLIDFHLDKKKKGYQITLCNGLFNKTFKEWKYKNKEFSGIIFLDYQKINPSLQEVFNYHDGETATKYLVERKIAIK